MTSSPNTGKAGKPGPQSSWTPERVAELARLWAAGESGATIAKQMGGLSRCAVLGKVRRLNLPFRAPSFKSSGRTVARPARIAAPKLPKALREPKPAKAAKRDHTPRGSVVEVLSPNPLTILELPLKGACRWIVDTDDALSCGNPCGDATYCTGHHRMAYVPTAKWRSQATIENAARFLEAQQKFHGRTRIGDDERPVERGRPAMNFHLLNARKARA